MYKHMERIVSEEKVDTVTDPASFLKVKTKRKQPVKQYAALIGVWVVTFIASVVEIVIGLRNNSLTLLTDGFHNFSDVLALMLAFAALYV